MQTPASDLLSFLKLSIPDQVANCLCFSKLPAGNQISISVLNKTFLIYFKSKLTVDENSFQNFETFQLMKKQIITKTNSAN